MKILKFLNLKGRLGSIAGAQNTIVSAAFILASSSGIAAVLGLVKGRLLAGTYGVSDELGIFYTADRIPTLIYSILVVGALSTVFIPIFTDMIKKDLEMAWRSASSIITFGVLLFFIFALAITIFAEPTIKLISLDIFTPDQVKLGANLMRIMLFGQMILVLSSFATSILQSFKLFFAAALAPILYNLGMIMGIVFLSPFFGIYGPALGVIIGAFLHLLIQLPHLAKLDFKLKPRLEIDTSVKEMLSLMPPRITSVVFGQIVATINNSLAIFISTSSVVILRFATQLQYFPVTLFGASMAAASLPVLSEYASEKNIDKYKNIFLTTLHQTLFLAMPAAVMLLILRVPIVRLVYGTSNFTWEDTVKTSYALAFFSISIFSQAIIYLTTRAFYSWKDTITPVKISIITILLNLCLSVFFVRYMGYGVWALAFSYSLTSYIDAIALIYLLSKKLGGFDTRSLLEPFIKIGSATLFMAISLYLPLKLLDQVVFDTTRTLNLLILTGIASATGVASYLFFTYMLKVEEIELFYKLIRKFRISDPRPSSPATVISETKENL
jgi:putative peptidoglycan lipid II flippase